MSRSSKQQLDAPVRFAYDIYRAAFALLDVDEFVPAEGDFFHHGETIRIVEHVARTRVSGREVTVLFTSGGFTEPGLLDTNPRRGVVAFDVATRRFARLPRDLRIQRDGTMMKIEKVRSLVLGRATPRFGIYSVTVVLVDSVLGGVK